MNRNPDGTLLTTEQLFEMAEELGVNVQGIRELHNKNLIRSKLENVTRVARFNNPNLKFRTEEFKRTTH